MLRPDSVDDAYDSVGQIIDRVVGIRLVALAMPGQIEKYETRVIFERGNLFVPEIPITRPAMDKDNRARPGPCGDIINLVALHHGERRLALAGAIQRCVRAR